MAEEDQERTELATPKRRREAREEGQVARSPEVLTAFVLAAGLVGLWVGAGFMYGELASLAGRLIRFGPQVDLTRDGLVALSVQVAGSLVRALFPVLLAAVVGGLAGNLVQVGFYVSFKAVAPNADRINPATGFKNLFQPAKLVDLVKNLIKVAAVGWAAYLALRDRLPELPFLTDLPPRPLVAYLLQVGFAILKNALVVYVVIALLDYAFQRWQYERKLKMTKQQVKDEYKETEGDPLLRSRIRSLQREMARRRMMAEVPRADVVVTNPTHFAVALRYAPAEMDAPRVVAKGADRVAERIVSLAREHRVPIYQDPPVARTLYRQVEIGEAIPADLFEAVAEILARVYRLSGRGPRP
ncbi:MAG: flagellar biosynthesis protein FlhB [Deferrisomatales bacterium]